jgi:hypothetical protein
MSYALPPLPPDDEEHPLEEAGRMLLMAIKVTAVGIALVDLFLICYSK